MTGITRILAKGVSAMLFAWLSVALWLFAVSSAAAAEGQVRLDDGSSFEWLLTDSASKPTLGFAAPAYVEWSATGIESIKIDLYTNYAAFIDRWELGLFRAGDTARKHPVRLWRGAAADMNAGVEWDGTINDGPALRPGETIIVSLRVRDVAGNMDEKGPQTVLISRYLMPVERKQLAKVTKARRKALLDTSIDQAIPVHGQGFTATVAAKDGNVPLHVSGLAMRKNRKGNWSLEQILPPGTHILKIQRARRIMGGTRLVSAGRVSVTVPQGDPLMVSVRGTGSVEREHHSLQAEGLKPDGLIAGSDAVALKLWKQDSVEGRLALATADPRIPVPLFKDRLGRNIARFDPPRRMELWGTGTEPSKARKIETRARFPAMAHQAISLPHTDIEAAPFRVSVRSGAKRVTYLIPRKHYIIDVTQGRIKLTDAGHAVVLEEKEKFSDSTIEVAYHIRQSLAGLDRRRSDGTPIDVEGSGEAMHITFESLIPEEHLLAIQPPEPGSASAVPEDSWVSRNFGWLTGG